MAEPLIYAMMEPFHLIDKVSNDDPYGGVVKGYQVGASFEAKVIKNNSTEAVVAEKTRVNRISNGCHKGFEVGLSRYFQKG